MTASLASSLDESVQAQASEGAAARGGARGPAVPAAAHVGGDRGRRAASPQLPVRGRRTWGIVAAFLPPHDCFRLAFTCRWTRAKRLRRRLRAPKPPAVAGTTSSTASEKDAASKIESCVRVARELCGWRAGAESVDDARPHAVGDVQSIALMAHRLRARAHCPRCRNANAEAAISGSRELFNRGANNNAVTSESVRSSELVHCLLCGYRFGAATSCDWLGRGLRK